MAGEPFVHSSAGSGPRHMVFHPNDVTAYVINERDSTIDSFVFEPLRGTLQRESTTSTLPPDFVGVSYCAEIHVTVDGRYVYHPGLRSNCQKCRDTDLDLFVLVRLGIAMTRPLLEQVWVQPSCGASALFHRRVPRLRSAVDRLGKRQLCYAESQLAARDESITQRATLDRSESEGAVRLNNLCIRPG